MHQDEALSVLEIYDGVHDTTNPSLKTNKFQVEYSSAPLINTLALLEGHNSMDSLVAAALQTIYEEKYFPKSLPWSSFSPHKHLLCSEYIDLGTIDITNKNLCKQDDVTLVSTSSFSILIDVSKNHNPTFVPCILLWRWIGLPNGKVDLAQRVTQRMSPCGIISQDSMKRWSGSSTTSIRIMHQQRCTSVEH
ncbi:hypothetical protein GOP47_0005517 [Adiantum capillus-veneris]|uniref:Uncharacterized protein n=1 Tax=Adiantum capillus-veneris TaxID=13818 RepID=A0A9D4V5H9_ADICA|nr:hypothetical protein GOP47_0005517 [Adiantum capillus-veneris]